MIEHLDPPRLAAFERSLLDQPGYATTHCKRVYSSTLPDEWRCETPISLLATLHVDPAQHQQQCESGYCNAPPAALSLCQVGAVAWGVFPCTSKAFDWRAATLAPEAPRVFKKILRFITPSPCSVDSLCGNRAAPYCPRP